MKEVLLTRGKVALVSDADWPIVRRYKWYADKGYQTWYARTNVTVGKRQTAIKMHRLLLGFPDSDVDHRNGNGLDNRRRNLRKANKSRNQANRGASRNNQSGIKGVYWHVRDGLWDGQVRKGGRTFSKRFMKKINAIKWVRQMQCALYGEFAHA